MGAASGRAGKRQGFLTCSRKAYWPQLAAAAPLPEHKVEVPAAALALGGRAAVKGVDLVSVQAEGRSAVVAEQQGTVQQH